MINQGLSRAVTRSDTVCHEVENGSCAWDRTNCFPLEDQGVERLVSHGVSHDLAEVIANWSALSPSLRLAIGSIVDSAKVEGGQGNA